jgi:hypothetical protein
VRDRWAAERLEAAVEQARAGSPVPGEMLDDDLRGRLRVAEDLAALDLASDSRVREVLRERLVSALEQGRAREAERLGRRPWGRRRPVLAVGLAALLAVVLLGALAPRTLAALVEPVVKIIERVYVGEHTEIVRTAPPTEAEVADTLERHDEALASGKSWVERTPYGSFAGRVPPGQPATLRRVESLDQLRSLTPLRLRIPTGLHRGQPVVLDHADVAPDGVTFLFFGSGANEIFLAAYPVGEGGRSLAYARAIFGTSPDGRTSVEIPELKTEELSLDGQKAVWDPWAPGPDVHPRDLSALRWEQDGVSYSLMGRSLTREEAIALYRSLGSGLDF